MSVEALAVAAVVEDGVPALRTFYAAGLTADDFAVYAEEFDWIEKRLTRRKTLNWRVFHLRFPDFEKVIPKDDPKDLAADLKEERAFEEVNSLIATLSERLERDTALDLAMEAREQLGRITGRYSPMADFVLEDWKDDIADIRQHMKIAKAGHPVGLSTGFTHLDHHWGGMLPGQFIEILGRTGEGKSVKTAFFALHAKLQGAHVGIFTPELSKHEVKSRIHTMASARPEIQKACDLERSFRNRALLFKRGFNLKSYERFCEYFETLPGRMHLLSGLSRPEQMTVGYIEDRIVDLGLDLVIVDPIYLLRPVRMSREGNPYQEIAWTAEALHRLSEQYKVPIIFTNQAHLDGGAKGDAPHKDRSFGAKTMAHLADYILGVRHVSDENYMICKCSKSRFGHEFRYEIDLFVNTGVIRERTPLTGSYFNGHSHLDADDAKEAVRTAQKGKTHA